MNPEKVHLLVSACITYGHLGYLNLEDQELICLYEECLSISQYFKDNLSVIQLYMLLDDMRGTKYFEKVSTHIKKIWKASEQNYREMAALAYAFILKAKRYRLLYNHQKAVECCLKAINISKDLGTKYIEGEAYMILALSYNELFEYCKMKECSENCVKIGKETRNKETMGFGYLQLGILYCRLGKLDKAISYLKQSIEIFEQIDNKQLLRHAFLQMGVVYGNLGNFDKAQQYIERSLKLEREIGSRKASSYLILGEVYELLGKNQEAMDCYQKSLSISISVRDKDAEGKSYLVLAKLYSGEGKYHKSIEYCEKSLKILKHIENRVREGEIYKQFAVVYFNVGKVQRSLETFKKALEIAIETGDKNGQIHCYRYIGHAYQYLKEYPKALEYFKKALNSANKIRDKIEIANAYCRIGGICLRLSNPGEAIKYFEKCINIATSINFKEGEVHGYYNLGEALFCIKKYGEAIKYSEKSLSVAKEISNKNIEGLASNLLGSLYYSLSVMYGEKGHEEECQYTKEKSEEKLKESFQCWEQKFTHLKDLNDFKISIVDRFIETYKMLIKVLIERQKTDEALLVSDRGRARSLGDILVTKYGITEERSPCQTPLDITGIESVLTGNQFCILFFAIGMEDVHTWVLTHQRPRVLVNTNNHEALTAVKGVQLEKGHSNVEVDIGEIIVNAVKEFGCEIPREMETKRFENRSFDSATDLSVERNVGGDSQMNVPERVTDQLEVLFSLLITPVIKHLQQEEIVIIPEGPLYMVPFAALRDPNRGKYLSETKSIRISPSLATLKTLQECNVDYHSKKGALIVGDPDVGEVIFEGEKKEFDRLPSAKREADVIAAILGGKPLTGSQATKEMVKKKLQEGVAVIHIAAHGDAEYGHIALAPPPRKDGASIPEEQDYMLTMEEVQEIGVTAQLVVLSCCHSGRGDIKAEGVVGMSRAFLAAGARAVVASLWAVDDEATSRFMTSFYASLKMGDSASKSLQNAMDDIRGEEGYEDPMYWAPFFLIGDDVTISV